ncbi:helix-turn-helix transcriptional regulator [Hornefia butyriciproducens]|uniref:helix-turn-helix transcriptional regulator n=1 Tax=Hornefia butyriciproducens TaxID=2652293 RepID=UPI003899B374
MKPTYRIRELRNEMHITQEELARMSGVSRSIISELESGKREVTTTDTIIKIASALGKKPNDIFLT